MRSLWYSIENRESPPTVSCGKADPHLAEKIGNCRMMRRLHSEGFTLVELLITTSLMAFVAGTLIAVLGAGLRVWKRTTVYGTQQQNALIAYERPP